MQRINSVVKISLLLIIMFIVNSFTNCGSPPGDIETGLVISYCPAHYVLDSPESLYVDIKYINKENSNLYVGLKGLGLLRV